MKDVAVRFYGGPMHGQYLSVPERLPLKWKVPIAPKIMSHSPPLSVPLGHALYELWAIVNVETRKVEEHYYKLVE